MTGILSARGWASLLMVSLMTSGCVLVGGNGQVSAITTPNYGADCAIPRPGMSTDPNVERVHTATIWEKRVGYCRAIRMGQTIAVTGTTSVDDQGLVYAAGDGYLLAKRCLEIIENSLAKLGAQREHIIRTRMFEADAILPS